MNEREDVEAELAAAIRAGSPPEMADALAARLTYALRPWLAAHDEAVRVSERVRLAEEVETLAGLGVRKPWPPDEWQAGIRAALDPTAGVRLTEEE